MLNGPDSARGRAVQGCVITAFLVWVLVLTLSAGKPARAEEAPRIEVFVTEEFLPLAAPRGATVYVIDGLSRIEAGLSRELPGDPEAAKALVLERFARMEAGQGPQLENAAQGLVRAMHYGIDRYPCDRLRRAGRGVWPHRHRCGPPALPQVAEDAGQPMKILHCLIR